MKILHIITSLERGGAETVLYRFLMNVSADERKGHFVVSLQGLGFFGHKLASYGVEVSALNMRGILSFPGAFLRLVFLIRKLRPNLIQTWLYHADLLGGIAAQFSGKPPVIWGVHTVYLDINTSFITKAIRFLCALTSKWLPKVILCVAHAAADNHIRLGYERKRVVVIPNGFDIPDMNSFIEGARNLRSSLGLFDSHLLVGSIGRFHPDKDYQTFLDAAAQLKSRISNARFLLVGRGLSTDNEVLVKLIISFGLENDIFLLGERDDVHVCLQAMDVFCLPSKTEAFPLVLGEAMSASRPVVATNVGDSALLVGDAGIVVPAQDSKMLCDGLHKMLSYSIIKRENIGIEARMRIESNFAMVKMVDDVLKLYRNTSANYV